MKAIKKIFSSSILSAFLFVLIAIALGFATILETLYDTTTAKEWIYDSIWLEVVYIFFCINLILNIFKYRWFKNGKISIGLFHISFLFIFLGAFITRYYSHEGIVHIREGESTNQYLTRDNYLSLKVDEVKKEKKMLLSNHLSNHYHLTNQNIKVKTSNYQPSVEKKLAPNPTGDAHIELVLIQNYRSEKYILQQEEEIEINGKGILFSNDHQSDIVISIEKGKPILSSKVVCREQEIKTAHNKIYPAQQKIRIRPQHVYMIDGIQLILISYLPKSIIQAVPSKNGQYASITAHLSSGTKTKEIDLFNIPGTPQVFQKINIENQNIALSFGQKKERLPFKLKLKDFTLDRYIGSSTPSSYKSLVTLTSSKTNKTIDSEISMNNTLKFDHYRFYQTSYDQDEKGTILTVNNDYWGTIITYIGYFLMIIGMIWSLFAPKSRFKKLLRRSITPTLTILLLLVFNQNTSAQNTKESFYKEFGKVWVQGHDGRIMPISTLANDFLRKSMWKTSYKGLSPEEVFFGIMANPEQWKEKKIIKTNKEVRSIILTKEKYVSFNDFFDPSNNRYKLFHLVNEAYRKAPNKRHQKDKEVIKCDEKVNLFNLVKHQSLLKTFPSPQSSNDVWISPNDIGPQEKSMETIFVKNAWNIIISEYNNKQYDKAIYYLHAISKFQKKYAAHLPSEKKNKLEQIYIHSNIFLKVFPIYLMLGFVFLFICFIKIVSNKNLSNRLYSILLYLLLIPFFFHTIGIVLRGIVSEHMPWSNGYESMIYVAWSIVLAGLIFAKKNPIVLASAALLSGITLFVSHLSWMNPEITFLVPVLKSYWLTFHVAIITASYGFIGISMFIGLVNMILILITNKKSSSRIEALIKQLSDINEASMIVGLYFLTIGTFLGGIWANEAWGRYWGWDPKETWSLVTILIYSFVTHMRLIPSFRSIFAFNVASIFSFSSVIMTYLGVNYYLSGLHSYGSGEAGNIGNYCILALLFLVMICGLAYKKYQKFYTNS
ncbi:MAG: cytochrome c biogenesis protein CcsA [Prolixibacteraceae bacterium]